MRSAHARQAEISVEPAVRLASNAAMQTTLSYLEPSGERPWHYMYDRPDGGPQHNCVFANHPAWIADARRSNPSLEREGFELREAPSAVRDFSDQQHVELLYYPEVAKLALEATGARHAFVFDHQVRRREADRAPLTFGRRGDGRQPGAAGRVHSDYTDASAKRRLSMHWKGSPFRRFAILNVWRSIAGPVLDTPLAVCDARSVSPAELVAGDVHYLGRSGEIFLVAHSPRHAWHYFPRMDRHEALVFKQYDSKEGAARFVPHGAFDLPDIPPDAPLRESVEARCLVVYD
jgi:hypothetical protein